ETLVDAEKSTSVENKRKGKEVVKPLTLIPRPPPPFTKRLKMKVEDEKFQKFISMLKKLSSRVLEYDAYDKGSGRRLNERGIEIARKKAGAGRHRRGMSRTPSLCVGLHGTPINWRVGSVPQTPYPP
ncbi:hypothetical protein HAX54_025914, partial [Datura stramonium]|nr:hypothetical protein [Datura stramonium]